MIRHQVVLKKLRNVELCAIAIVASNYAFFADFSNRINLSSTVFYHFFDRDDQLLRFFH